MQRVVTQGIRLSAMIAIVLLAGCAGNRAKLNKQYTNVWDRITDGYGIPPLKDNSRVDYWKDYYRARPGVVNRMAKRSAKYIYYVTTELEKRSMPTELALLPFVESAYNVHAYSRSHAAGLWQFIPSTGSHYKLRQSWVIDQRRDPVEATQAALNYLQYLYKFQGNDWHLALASYNWGEGAVKRAIARNQADGLGTTYNDLRMPNETSNYVPKLLAIAQIIARPSSYGVRLPNIPDRPYFTEVHQEKNMDMDVAARLAGMSVAEFRELNPAFNTPVLLASHANTFLLPISRLATYERNLKNYKGRLSQWETYTPSGRESLASIAKQHDISLARLKEVNGYGRHQKLAYVGRLMLVPARGGRGNGLVPPTDVVTSPSIEQSGRAMVAQNSGPGFRPSREQVDSAPISGVRYASYSGAATDPVADLALKTEDLGDISKARVGVQRESRLGMREEKRVATRDVHIMTPVYHGRVASHGKVRVTSFMPLEHKRKQHELAHVVAAGDTLYSLARRYNTSVESLRRLNNIRGNALKKGAVIRLPGSHKRG